MSRTSKTQNVQNFTQLYTLISKDFAQWHKTLCSTALKINKFIWDYKDLLIFAIISATSFIIAPYRFASGSVFFYLALKNNYTQVDSDAREVSTTNLVMNIIGVFGTLFHTYLRSLSNGILYLTPLLSGFATANIFYTFYTFQQEDSEAEDE